MSEEKKHFKEINVERINVVEEDGRLRMVIHNNKNVPDPMMEGEKLDIERKGMEGLAGITFYNAEEDECGGLVFGSDKEKKQAGAGLMFDAYKQDQIMGLLFDEEDSERKYGIRFWDRPEDETLREAIKKIKEIEQMEEGSEKEKEKLKKTYPQRMFVGRNKKGETEVTMNDSNGQERIRMKVDEEDNPKIEFLDENGEVTYSLPPESNK